MTPPVEHAPDAAACAAWVQQTIATYGAATAIGLGLLLVRAGATAIRDGGKPATVHELAMLILATSAEDGVQTLADAWARPTT